MDKRVLIPNTSLEVCPIGLGTVNAGLRWDGRDANRIFDYYLDRGGNLIDTAHVYSDWVKPEIARSERVVGDWLTLSKKRNKLVLMTKGGHPDMAVENPDRHKSRMTKKDMISDLDGSLKKLRTDYIDIYFYHRDDERTSVEELVETMQGFVDEGKIRYFGCSNWSTARMKEAADLCKSKGYRGFVANQALMNLGHKYKNPLSDDTMKAIDQEMYEYHTKNLENLAMPYAGVAGGFFHKYITKGEEEVKSSPYYTEGNIKIIEKVIRLMEEYNASISQVVLGFFTQQDFPCVPLYGPNNTDQIEEALKTFEISFKKSDFDI